MIYTLVVSVNFALNSNTFQQSFKFILFSCSMVKSFAFESCIFTNCYLVCVALTYELYYSGRRERERKGRMREVGREFVGTLWSELCHAYAC